MNNSKRKIIEIENDLSESTIMRENTKHTKRKSTPNNNNNNNNSDYDDVDDDDDDDEENQVTNDGYYDVSKVNIEEIISTEDIAQNLKNFLAKERIKHEVFSKSILNCSKSTLARLLYEPKTWQTINDMWKLYFKIIYLWLNDRKRLDKLNYNKKLPQMVKTESDDSAPSSSFIITHSSNSPTNNNIVDSISSNDNEFDIIETFRSIKKS